MIDPMTYIAKLSVPLGIMTTVLGGSAWLTTMHNKIDEVEKELSSFTTGFNEQREKVSNQESNLARIEGKLDVLLDAIRRRNEDRDNRNGSKR